MQSWGWYNVLDVVTHSQVWEQDRVLEMPADQVLTFYCYLLDKNKKERLDMEARSRQSK